MTRWVWLSLVLVAAAVGVSLYVYGYRFDLLPERVPTHWNIEGKPDAWAPRDDLFMNFMLMPIFMAVMVGLIWLLPWLSPRSFQVTRFRDTFHYSMFLVTLLFGYLHTIILLGSLKDVNLDIGKYMVAGFFLFFGLLGNVLGKVKRNFWIGIRTPWTLANETVWDRTHRMAGWLWVVMGLTGFIATVLGVPVWIGFIVVLVGALYPVVYSLYLYKVLESQGKLHEESSEVPLEETGVQP